MLWATDLAAVETNVQFPFHRLHFHCTQSLHIFNVVKGCLGNSRAVVSIMLCVYSYPPKFFPALAFSSVASQKLLHAALHTGLHSQIQAIKVATPGFFPPSYSLALSSVYTSSVFLLSESAFRIHAAKYLRIVYGVFVYSRLFHLQHNSRFTASRRIEQWAQISSHTQRLVFSPTHFTLA